ncbi:MAG: HisA/HisF-related TIM barrel protein [Candidatus Nezhaarchaeota archaeon]|nr:HisA/HisF-related TIM barrel protein [Candidatus Nezhaarchaeota archaeon]
MKLRVIPAVDLRRGLAVHAVRGERDRYEPLRSCLARSPDPLALGRAFKSMGLSELYIADLDLIERVGSNLEIVAEIKRKLGLRLIVDAGVSSPSLAEELVSLGVDEVVVGTETLNDLAELEEVVRAVGGSRVAASIDLVSGSLLTKSARLRYMSTLEVARALASFGVAELIVIELKKVGSKEGPDLELAKRIVEAAEVPVLVGGGVRGLADLISLSKVGVAGALVATALHDGSIGVAELALLATLRPLASSGA